MKQVKYTQSIDDCSKKCIFHEPRIIQQLHRFQFIIHNYYKI